VDVPLPHRTGIGGRFNRLAGGSKISHRYRASCHGAACPGSGKQRANRYLRRAAAAAWSMGFFFMEGFFYPTIDVPPFNS